MEGKKMSFDITDAKENIENNRAIIEWVVATAIESKNYEEFKAKLSSKLKEEKKQ
jgi:hypothetical protein